MYGSLANRNAIHGQKDIIQWKFGAPDGMVDDGRLCGEHVGADTAREAAQSQTWLRTSKQRLRRVRIGL